MNSRRWCDCGEVLQVDYQTVNHFVQNRLCPIPDWALRTHEYEHYLAIWQRCNPHLSAKVRSLWAVVPSGSETQTAKLADFYGSNLLKLE